jgi:hypothetical protein
MVQTRDSLTVASTGMIRQWMIRGDLPANRYTANGQKIGSTNISSTRISRVRGMPTLR